MTIFLLINFMETSLLRETEVERYEGNWHKYFMHNWDNERKKRQFYIRLMGLLVMILTIYLVTRINMPVVSYQQCMADKVFGMTNALNMYFAMNTQVKNAFEIFSSTLIDINLLCFAILYGLWGTTWKPLVFSGSFFIFRGSLQAATVLGFPDGFIWEFPGLYSVLVTYVKSSDFFFSGHVGVMLFCGMFFYEHGHNRLLGYSIFCIFCEAIVMVLVRCHYGIDIVGGLIFSHYIWIISEWPAKIVDKLGYNEPQLVEIVKKN